MKSSRSRKYSMEESDFVLSVLGSLSYKFERNGYNDQFLKREGVIVSKIRRQLRSKKGRSDACKWLLDRLLSLSDKDKFHYSVVYEENGQVHYSLYSETEWKLRGLIDNE